MRRSLVLGIVLGGFVLLLFDAFASRLGVARSILPRVDGEAPWIAARALGLTAFVALSLQMVFGLLSSSGTADRWMGRARAIDVHGFLSGLSLALFATHAAVFLLDRYVSFDLIDLLVPFAARERTVGVALGIFAFDLAIAVHLTSVFRKRLGARAFKRWHRASFVVFVGGLAHGIVAGTDSSAAWVRAMLAIAAATVVSLAAIRISVAIRRDRRSMVAHGA